MTMYAMRGFGQAEQWPHFETDTRGGSFGPGGRGGGLFDGSMAFGKTNECDFTNKKAYPWRKGSHCTLGLQKALNERLKDDSFIHIKPDGFLGPRTCGAAKHYGIEIASCKKHKAQAPTKRKAKDAGEPGTAAEAAAAAPTMWLYAGLAVVVGGAAWFLMRRRKA